MRRVRAVERVDAHRLVDGDTLVRAPRFSVPARARHHALDTHQRCKGSGTEVRARARGDAGVEQRAEGHAALHQLFTVKLELVRVVVRVAREESRHRAGRFQPPQQIIVDQRAMRDLGTRVRARE